MANSETPSGAVAVSNGNEQGAAQASPLSGTPGDDVLNGSPGSDRIDGKGGDDIINGQGGDDDLSGGPGNDTVTGGTGNDTARLGPGDDIFIWNPGDGSDTVEGQGGFDTLQFNGANVNETMDISANGGRALLHRDVGNVSMDLNGVERIAVKALGGTDTITANDLTGTGVKQVAIDLGSSAGGGDGQPDTVVVNGTDAADVITVTNTNGTVTMSGLAQDITISNFDPTDHLVINGLGGDDVINALGLGTGMLFIGNGGDGNDLLAGSDGADTLSGGPGDDVLIGGAGQDILDGGPGQNVIIQDQLMPPLDAMFASVGSAGQAVLQMLVGNGAASFGGAVGTGMIAAHDVPPSAADLLVR